MFFLLPKVGVVLLLAFGLIAIWRHRRRLRRRSSGPGARGRHRGTVRQPHR